MALASVTLVSDETAMNVLGLTGVAIFLACGLGFVAWWLPNFIQFRQSYLEGEFEVGEHLWAFTYVQYHPGGVWGGVGVAGRLFLTNEALEFRASPGQPSLDRLVIPLLSVRRARVVWMLFGVQCSLHVEREDGSVEAFRFGFTTRSASEWAQAIMEFRDDLEEGKT